MQKLKLSVEGLVGAAILNALVFAFDSAHLAWMPTVAALAVLCVVLAFDRQEARSFGESVAYAACCGLLLATAALFPLEQYVHDFVAPIDALSGHPLLPAVWVLCLLGFLTADRVRNNTTPTTVQFGTATSLPGETSVRAPRPAAAPTAAPVVPATNAQPAPQGKPATINVNLLGMGMVCLRPIQAEHLSKDFYRIIEPVPEGEQWQFQTGQVVRCRKERLSNGKGLVAFEEAPRASAPPMPADGVTPVEGVAVAAEAPIANVEFVAPSAPANDIPATAIEVTPQPAPQGKPVTIHVNLVGMGISCLRPIQAERLGKDFYRIVEPAPEGEEWEFQTGQIVRCRKQSLSSGKGLVAFEEAPRA